MEKLEMPRIFPISEQKIWVKKTHSKTKYIYIYIPQKV